MDGGSIVMGKVIGKGKVNGFEASYSLAMLGNIVLNVVDVLHEYRKFS